MGGDHSHRKRWVIEPPASQAESPQVRRTPGDSGESTLDAALHDPQQLFLLTLIETKRAVVAVEL
jgi:hypothetical protein